MSLLEVKELTKYYPIKKPFQDTKYIKAIDGISFSVGINTTLGIVGESGCGKSTLAKQLMKLESMTSGEIIFPSLNNEKRHSIQMIFQDPYNSLNPRKKCWQIIAEPLLINTKLSKKACFNQALEMMKLVGLRPELANRYPHMFSGGQRQRIGIARSLILKPKVLICDEPVSALDVSIQAQVLNLLIKLQNELNLTYLFISHDLSVVKHIADNILVMYLGKVVEYGPRQEIFNSPAHPYTQALLSSSPTINSTSNQAFELTGELPSPLDPPQGCHFHQRCPFAVDECKISYPEKKIIGTREVSCHIV